MVGVVGRIDKDDEVEDVAIFWLTCVALAAGAQASAQLTVSGPVVIPPSGSSISLTVRVMLPVILIALVVFKQIVYRSAQV